MCVRDRASCYERASKTMRRPIGMALFGMVWLLRVRSEMKRCAKCRRDGLAAQQRADRDCQRADLQRTPASCSTFFTIDAPGAMPSTETLISPERLGPTTYCEVHGYNPPKEDIQEFYELTLLDENKSVQEKTAETIRIANKWEANDGPITPSYTNNDFIAFAALVAVARGSGIVSAPVARAVVAEPYDPNPQYSYGYEVQDPLTGDSHGQVETRSGDVVQGSYALLDSDGTRRQVDYTADPINGFNAVVSKQPVAVAVPAVAKVAAPIAPVAPVLRAAPLAAAPIAPVAPVLRAAPLAAAPIAPVAPWLQSAPLAAAPLLRSAPFAAAPLAPSVLRSAPLAAAPIAPIATPWAAPVVRSAPLW